MTPHDFSQSAHHLRRIRSIPFTKKMIPPMTSNAMDDCQITEWSLTGAEFGVAEETASASVAGGTIGVEEESVTGVDF